MFQTAYNIALCKKCNINVRAGGLFEEGIIQKIVGHLITLVNNTDILKVLSNCKTPTRLNIRL